MKKIPTIFAISFPRFTRVNWNLVRFSWRDNNACPCLTFFARCERSRNSLIASLIITATEIRTQLLLRCRINWSCCFSSGIRVPGNSPRYSAEQKKFLSDRREIHRLTVKSVNILSICCSIKVNSERSKAEFYYVSWFRSEATVTSHASRRS